jgi:aminomethyltransferase
VNHTPLYDTYKSLPGAKLIEFGGWEMPVNFQAGIIGEHEAVRTKAGIFDVSHMGQVELQGQDAPAVLQWLLTNDMGGLRPGRARYSPMCYPDGGTVDDLLVYCLAPDRYLLVVNAANTQKDYRWINEHAGSCDVVDRSADYALIAVQGPESQAVLQRYTDYDLSTIRPFRFAAGVTVAGRSVLASRTGYTGEDGFELYMAPEDAPTLWNALVDQEAGILPCGLGARDTLRLEAALPLYGHELSPEISPLEAGLQSFVKLETDDFCGKEALSRMAKAGVPRHIIGCRMVDRGVPRHGYAVSVDDSKVGQVTSGSRSPTLDAFIALALVQRGVGSPRETVLVDMHGKAKQAEVVETPFYSRRSTN